MVKRAAGEIGELAILYGKTDHNCPLGTMHR